MTTQLKRDSVVAWSAPQWAQTSGLQFGGMIEHGRWTPARNGVSAYLKQIDYLEHGDGSIRVVRGAATILFSIDRNCTADLNIDGPANSAMDTLNLISGLYGISAADMQVLREDTTTLLAMYEAAL